MSAKPAPAAPAREAGLYRAAVEATPGAELKGAAMPYTAVNGNMSSFIDKEGVCAIRLSREEREAFVQEFATTLYHHEESGVVMKEYVTVPPNLLSDVKHLAGWLGRSLTYVRSLKPKATTKTKKSAE